MTHDPPAPLNNNDEVQPEVEPPSTPLFRGSGDLERRLVRRIACDAGSVCQILDPRTGRSWPAAIRNLSVTGISLLSARRFEASELLSIELSHASRGFSRRYLVQVRHSDICCPDDAWLHGCCFARPLREEELRALL
jgi:hypothetical protein